MVGHARTFNEMFAPGEQEMMYRITYREIITTILSLVVLASGVCAIITINSFSAGLAVIAVPIIGFVTLGLMMDIAFIDASPRHPPLQNRTRERVRFCR
jgi:hypothetical protein